MKKLAYPLFAIMLGSSVGCTNMDSQQQGTLSGAAIGAAAGAGISAIAGGNGWTGAVIGGAAGAIAGDMRGSQAK